jgi:hypothetical protein
MHIYEYLFAAAIMITMLLASSSMIETLSAPHTQTSEREQLKMTSEKIMNQILFNPGNPPNWGSDPSVPIQGLQTFGLAQYNETTRGAYVLDPDKILRLSNDINTNVTLRPIIPELLNLGNEYGIALELATPLEVNVTATPDSGIYAISVTSQEDGLPVYKATITASVYYVDNGQIVNQKAQPNWTDPSGTCTIDFSNLPAQTKALIVVVDYANICVVKVLSDKQARIFGNQILSNQTLGGTACQVLITEGNGARVIENVTSGLTSSANGWYQLTDPEPSTIATLAVSNNDVICASRDVSNVTYSSISVDFSKLINPVSYSIERTVTINQLAYSITLYVWRMSY